MIQEVARATVPVVLAVRPLVDSDLPVASSDDIAGGVLAATHLAELGHRVVAELAGPDDVRPFIDRSIGFKRGAEKSGLICVDVGERASHPTPGEGRRLMERLLKHAAERPSAVFAHNDSMAIGALAAMEAAGLRCPANISILGYNDAPLVDHILPPLSTIRYPGEQIGRAAAEIAVGLIDGASDVALTRLFPPALVARESTAPPG